jgi:hypothetical protein
LVWYPLVWFGLTGCIFCCKNRSGKASQIRYFFSAPNGDEHIVKVQAAFGSLHYGDIRFIPVVAASLKAWYFALQTEAITPVPPTIYVLR